jgi:hypothetical protein
MRYCYYTFVPECIIAMVQDAALGLDIDDTQRAFAHADEVKLIESDIIKYK